MFIIIYIIYIYIYLFSCKWKWGIPIKLATEVGLDHPWPWWIGTSLCSLKSPVCQRPSIQLPLAPQSKALNCVKLQAVSFMGISGPNGATLRNGRYLQFRAASSVAIFRRRHSSNGRICRWSTSGDWEEDLAVQQIFLWFNQLKIVIFQQQSMVIQPINTYETRWFNNLQPIHMVIWPTKKRCDLINDNI